MRTLSTESRTSRIGLITLDAKQTGERKAGNPPIAFDVAGTGNVAWSRCCDTSQPKGRGNREHKLRPKPARQSPTLLMSGDGKRSVGLRPQATAPILDSTSFTVVISRWPHVREQCYIPRAGLVAGMPVDDPLQTTIG